MSDTDVKAPMFKLITAWLIAIWSSTIDIFASIPWDKLAQFAAFVYSCLLIYEYIRKRIRAIKAPKAGEDNGTKQDIA